MKKKLIIISQFSFLGLGFLLGNKPSVSNDITIEAKPLELEVIAATPVTPPPEPRAVKEVDNPSVDPEQIFSDIKMALNNPSGRELLAASMGIFQLSSDEIEELLKNPKLSLFRTPDESHPEILTACFARLAEIDPENALKLTDSIDIKLKDTVIKAVFKQWSVSDGEAALTASLDLEDTFDRKTALVQVINTISETDPERALTLAIENDSSETPLAESHTYLLLKMAELDPLLAIKKSREIPVKGVMGKRFKYTQESAIMSLWAKKDPDAALAHILESDDDSDKALFALNLVKTYISTDPEKAFELLEASKDVISGGRLTVALRELTEQGPHKVISWIDKTYSGDQKDDLTRTSIASWYTDDKDAALEYFDGLEDPELKKIVSSGILNSYRYSDPKQFLELYPKMTSGSKFDEGSYNVLLRNFTQKDPVFAKQYIDSITDPKLKSLALAPYLIGIVRNNPYKSFQIAANVQDPAERKALQGSLYPYLAIKNPAIVADAFIDNEFQDFDAYDFGNFIDNYSRTDINKASEVVNTMPDGTQRDSAVQTLIQKFDADDPNHILEWANSISNDDTRVATMKSTYDDWFKRDPKSANEWIQSTDILAQATKDQWSQ